MLIIQFHYFDAFNKVIFLYQCDAVVDRASTSQLVDLEVIPQVESYQKTLKDGIHSFSVKCSAKKEQCREQASNLACCVFGQDT